MGNRLLTQPRDKIGGGKLLQLIGRYLRAGVEPPDGSREDTPLGVPQGGPLSPLLAKLIRSPPSAPSPLAGRPAGWETDCRQAARRASEAQSNPHAGWCGRGGRRNPATSTRLFLVFYWLRCQSKGGSDSCRRILSNSLLSNGPRVVPSPSASFMM